MANPPSSTTQSESYIEAQKNLEEQLGKNQSQPITKYPKTRAKTEGNTEGYLSDKDDGTINMLKVLRDGTDNAMGHAMGDKEKIDFEQGVNEFVFSNVFKILLPTKASSSELVIGNDESKIYTKSEYLQNFKTINTYISDIEDSAPFNAQKQLISGVESQLVPLRKIQVKDAAIIAQIDVLKEEKKSLIEQKNQLISDGLYKITGIEKVLAACMFSLDSDIHFENIGVIQEKNGSITGAAKIDHGWAGTNITGSSSVSQANREQADSTTRRMSASPSLQEFFALCKEKGVINEENDTFRVSVDPKTLHNSITEMLKYDVDNLKDHINHRLDILRQNNVIYKEEEKSLSQEFTRSFESRYHGMKEFNSKLGMFINTQKDIDPKTWPVQAEQMEKIMEQAGEIGKIMQGQVIQAPEPTQSIASTNTKDAQGMMEKLNNIAKTMQDQVSPEAKHAAHQSLNVTPNPKNPAEQITRR